MTSARIHIFSSLVYVARNFANPDVPVNPQINWRPLRLAAVLIASLAGAGEGRTQSMLSPTPMTTTAPRLEAPAPAAQAPGETGAPAGAAPASAQPAAAKKARPKPKPPAREFAIPNDPTPTLQPETFFSTAKASERYAAIADAGGWPRVPSALSPGAKGKAVAILRQRLAIEGDLPAAEANGEAWSPGLTDAVKRYQFRLGLRQTGAVSGKTLTAMNISAAVRFRQLASSAQRIAGSEFAFGQRYVVVNIPSAYVEAVENGRVVRRYVAVVGDVKHQSPTVTTRIVNVNLNPTWTVPTSIIKNEIGPRMQRDPGYLSRARIRVLDSSGAEVNPASVNWGGGQGVNYTLRQDSGNSNALGNIRINMPNNQAVYMHDTPSKRSFNSDYRFLSHGCVRVEGVFDLAEWLLQQTPGGWSKAQMLKVVGTQKRQDVRLAQPVPVTWIYMTGWASADGTVHFRDDLYNIDKVGGARTAAAQ